MIRNIIEGLGFSGDIFQSKRKMVRQVIGVSHMFTHAYMGWILLGSILNHCSPFVVVLSGSMEPGFQRGDILFMSNVNENIECNDIVVFETKKNEIPIVHRVVNKHISNKTNKYYYLTKGDNNRGNDRGLYNNNMIWIDENHIKAKIKGYVPYIGMLSIMIKENNAIKSVFIAFLCILTFLNEEE
eukprot:GHVP01054704.1.p1 GENE.GHVP01054704.1~~GHVP01054704.1.p1  ORF type:complete len:185 (-),score=11.84 GHVP01054704.1:261-815(-)